MKAMDPLLKILLYLIILIIVGIIVLFIYSLITEYRPDKTEILFKAENNTTISYNKDIDILIWNIGYSGLGSDMDFFYDGGKRMRTSRERFSDNLKNITQFISAHSYFDIILLQEIDIKSKRSFYTNIYDSIEKTIPNATHIFATNYKAKHVPIPITNPMGKVHSGLSTISHAVPAIAKRYSYPGNYKWPGSIFNLKRCFLLSRYNLPDEKELIIINTHNSAYDDGSLRKLQMDYLKQIMLSEYEKGNYVIAGGDWNQLPPDFKQQFLFNVFDTIQVQNISVDYLPGWKWVYDAEIPTNRRLESPYDAASTLTTLIDYFLVSPNVDIIEIKGMHLDFIYSDHNPVIAKFRLNNNY